MAKTLKSYVKKLTERCLNKFGKEFIEDNEELIECAARNKKLLDRFDEEISSQDLKSISIGSTGQQKEDINPLIKHRNDIAKLYADNLDALQLTQRSKFKKQDNKNTGDDDAMSEYFGTLID